MVFSTGRFVSSLVLLFVLVFQSSFGTVITWLEEERAGLCALHASICLCFVLSIFSSSLCQGLAMVCDCSTPWSSPLTFLNR